MNNETPKISKQQMLLELQSSQFKPFLLKFIASSDGRLCLIERCVYGGQKRNKDAQKGSRSVPHNVPKMKDGGKIPVTNLDAPDGDAFRSPFISHIIQFNQYRVMH